MQINDFKEVVTTFADPGTELLFERNQVVIQVNGDLIEVSIGATEGDVYVDEGAGRKIPANKWILTRLANLPLLASRLLSRVEETKHFVSPTASLLPTLEKSSDGKLVQKGCAVELSQQTLGDRSPLETMVLYVTSDAGEGKTSLINELARKQAQLYTRNETDWLLVPIPLGGRHFLRFDDITIGALQNRYRFPFLYYNSFLALVKMGVIVPAFDGFEEMFVESSSGEALSAMGILVGSLQSQGAMVVAARKAYFEFENLRTQERLFDTIRNYSVGFGKLEISRWEEKQFVEYCEKRGVVNPGDLYQRVAERLGADHALLTRAVLVKRLVDIASTTPSLDTFLERLLHSGQDFFSVFVRGLIEREANEKWIDRSGEKEVGSPLLSVDEHCDLLSLIAISMWENKVDYLKRDGLEFVAEYFCELANKDAYQTQQIRERLRGHAMLVTSPNAEQALEFDHDEFRLFFLGEGLAQVVQPLNERAKADVLGVFRRGVLPKQAQHAFIRATTRNEKLDQLEVVKFLLEVADMDTKASYTQENSSDVVISMLSGLAGKGLNIQEMTFGPDALRDRKLSNLAFQNCFFSASSLDLTELTNCTFERCSFTQLRIHDSTKVSHVTFNGCRVEALSLVDKEWDSWNPEEIQFQLNTLGIDSAYELELDLEGRKEKAPDSEIRDMEKIVRYFMRSTHISESVMRMKLGSSGQNFIDQVVPKLLKAGVMEEIDNRGGGDQRRFRLCSSLENINKAIASANGSFETYLEYFSSV
ncbi:hypothetical protein [Sedimenticola sp.]|uniref:hypothetical protein n=1 Tax=Sedimenticola sp. TaxID=1940285 RepID=UPI003D09D140